MHNITVDCQSRFFRRSRDKMKKKTKKPKKNQQQQKQNNTTVSEQFHNPIEKS
jgi:hypothetical protein